MGFGCSGSTTPTVVDPDPLKTQFVMANGKNPYGSTWAQTRLLTIREAETLVDAIRAASGNNPYLQDAVIVDFTNTPLVKQDSDVSMVTVADPDHTTISFRLNLGDPKITYDSPGSPGKGDLDPGGGLGTMLLHERLHWESIGSGMTAEGAPYGLEYYFAKRANLTRALQILVNGEWADGWKALPRTHYLFCLWAFCMKWCYDIADGKMAARDMTRTKALQCAKDFVTDGHPIIETGTDRGTALAWARQQINLKFGSWEEGDYLPGTKLQPADSRDYRAECRNRISSIISAAIP